MKNKQSVKKKGGRKGKKGKRKRTANIMREYKELCFESLNKHFD